MNEAEFAATFTAAMDSRGAYCAPLLAKCLVCVEYGQILGIGGGSGIYTCHIVIDHPQVHASVLDKLP